MSCLSPHQWLTHVTGRSVSGCVFSAPVDQCAPVLTTTWPTTAHVWRDRAPPSHHSVSLQIQCSRTATVSPAFTLSNSWVALHSDAAYEMLVHPEIPPPQLPPQGLAKFSVRTAGAASSTPVRWPSVAASPATPARDARSTSAGTTARTAAHALLLIQVKAWHVHNFWFICHRLTVWWTTNLPWLSWFSFPYLAANQEVFKLILSFSPFHKNICIARSLTSGAHCSVEFTNINGICKDFFFHQCEWA